MRNMKSAYLALMATSLMFDDSSSAQRRYTEKTPKLTPEQKKEIEKMRENYINKSRGLNQFYYGETLIWAINQKNADKKAKKKGLI